jgi:hypothetical protein
MKVKELIKELKKFNPEEIVLSDYGYDIKLIEEQEFVSIKGEVGYETPLKNNRRKKFKAVVMVSEQS